MVTLTEPEKMIVLAVGIGAVVVTIVLVVCLVAPLCPLHRLLPEHARIRLTTPLAVKKRKKIKKPKGDVNGNAEGELTQLRTTSYISYSNDLHEHEVNESALMAGIQQQQQHQHQQTLPMTTTTSPPDSLHFKPAHQQRRPTILSTRDSTVDSTYSSMTPTGSRPSSPVSSKGDPPDPLSSLDSGSVRSADTSPLYGSVTVSLQLSTTEDPNMVRILIGIQEAQDLPARDGIISCGDPFFRVSVVKESRAFRRSKTRSNVLAEFETSAQKKTRHPIYNQKFAKEISKTDIKDCVIKFAAFDKDKYVNPTEFGEAAVTLKNLNLALQGQPVLFCLELSEPKQNNGELQLSLMYLPTAERLAFNLFKVSNLRPDGLKGEPENFKVFVRVMLLHNGKMVTKKKTSAAGLLPVPHTFDESIAFDVPTEQMQNLSFVVVVVAIPKDSTVGSADVAPTNDSSPEGSYSSHVGQERCIGKVVVGPRARSTGNQHWELALQRPREQVVLWHILR